MSDITENLATDQDLLDILGASSDNSVDLKSDLEKAMTEAHEIME